MDRMIYFAAKLEDGGETRVVAYALSKPSHRGILAELDLMRNVDDIELRSQMLHHYEGSLLGAQLMFFRHLAHPVYFDPYVKEDYRTSTMEALKSGIGTFKGHDRVVFWAPSPEQVTELQLKLR